MSALIELVTTIPDVSDPEAVLTEITSPSIRHVVYQGEQTIAAIDTVYGPAFAAAVVVGFESAIEGMKAGNADQKAMGALWQIYFDRFKSPGWDLSDDTIRARLDNLVPIVGQQTVDAIKAMGVLYKSPCEVNGIENPSLQDVEAAIAIVQNRRAVANWAARVDNEILRPRDPDATIASLKLDIAGLE